MYAKFIVAITLLVPATSMAQTTTTYTYDALGRLTASSNQTGQASVMTNIGHDAAGNRTTYKVSGSPNGNGDPGAGAGAPKTRTFIVVPLNGFTIIPLG